MGIAYFNPRSPHGERQFLYVCVSERNRFQSTLPARGATKSWRLQTTWTSFQSTLPARGATDFHGDCYRDGLPFQSTLPARGATWNHHGSDDYSASYFNPRSPHGERRPPRCFDVLARCRHFNPRSPHGERRKRQARRIVQQQAISIHAPRTGSDEITAFQAFIANVYFNPRSPHGERRQRYACKSL